MNITFQKRPGIPSLGIAFFWRMEIKTESPVTLTDNFIPELFFDYFYIQEGKIRCVDKVQGTRSTLSAETLKTIHTHPLALVYSTPLVLYGARLSLRFAESFREELHANRFLRQSWVSKITDNLDVFRSQVLDYLAAHRTKKNPYPMFTADLEESAWLVNFSARHKRRLYRTTFGLSRKEMQNVRNLHSFLEQACDFAAENPRIIRHIAPDVFYDQPHLNHAFKKMTGFSPVEYFQANSILQDHLMSASYNEFLAEKGRL
ncbi:MAG TPA: AraC family transcriptional regulator [Anaerolineales bacterium]|nr:AraC family transcriptional regulator [Anaerolineales bacterium]